MTPADRELFDSLRRQQGELQGTLARLQEQLNALEARNSTPVAHAVPPPLPHVPEHAHNFPPIPVHIEAAHDFATEEPPHILPPLPDDREPVPDDFSPFPPLPPAEIAHPAGHSLEFRLGKWLTRMGGVFFVLLLISADGYFQWHKLLGPWGKLGVMGLLSMGVVALGQRLEKKAGLLLYGRTLMAAGLAGLYFALYAASYLDYLRVNHAHPILGGVLLLAWSVYVLHLAERRQSQTLAVFSVLLAYVSSAINPIGAFTMGADLLLALTAVYFLMRHSWATLSYLSLAGTYFALLRRLVVDENGELVLDTSRSIHFWPHAVYLAGTWAIFTAPVFGSRSPNFRAGKRLAFLSLNNGALIGLLALTAHLVGYGPGFTSRTLLVTGALLLVTSRLAGWVCADAAEVTGAYLAQGLAVFTCGIVAVYTGVARGLLLGLETLFIGAAGAYSRNAILRTGACVAAFLTLLFLLWEIGFYHHHPWTLGFSGAALMFLNAWFSRRNAGRNVVISSAYYCALALGLIFIAMETELSDSALPPALAFTALLLTFSVYLLPLFELPPVAQTLLLVAQTLVLFPVETGETLPRWSTACVAVITLLLTTWWSHQRVTRRGVWIFALNLIYALALVGLVYHAVRPYVDMPGWLVSASLLSAAFLAFGAFTRVWPIAVMGQAFLAVAIYHFLLPPGAWELYSMPWSWSAAAVLIAVVFGTGRALHQWLRVSPEITGSRRTELSFLAYAYQSLSLLFVVRSIFAVVPPIHQVATFLFMGTLVLALSIRRMSRFGVRCGSVLSFIGIVVYFYHVGFLDPHALATLIVALSMFSLLSQAALLRPGGVTLVTTLESWLLILLSSLTGWLFVSEWVITRLHPNYLTAGWAVYALFLFLFGLFAWERRQRWCGLAILIAAIIRVFAYDFWGFSGGYRVLTLVVLTVITLGLGFIYARFAERLKMWL